MTVLASCALAIKLEREYTLFRDERELVDA
jgi:hypothetical protein